MFKSYSEGNWYSNSQNCFGVILVAISFHSYLDHLYTYSPITDPQAWAPLGFSSPCGRFSSQALQVGGLPPAQPPLVVELQSPVDLECLNNRQGESPCHL